MRFNAAIAWPARRIIVFAGMMDRARCCATSLLVTAVAAAVAAPAYAHSGSVAGGFAGGFAHPLFGPDHIVAMVAVGLWGAFLGPPALWLLPITFPLVMAFGGVLGIVGVPLPGVEIGIAVSAIVLGLMVALAARPPLWIAALLVGAFAIFHGHAHGAELPASADAVAFSLGFVIATGMLHLCGIGLGQLARWPAGRIAVRAAGGAIALAGVAFLTGVA
jgi:urease accessory protein